MNYVGRKSALPELFPASLVDTEGSALRLTLLNKDAHFTARVLKYSKTRNAIKHRAWTPP